MRWFSTGPIQKARNLGKDTPIRRDPSGSPQPSDGAGYSHSVVPNDAPPSSLESGRVFQAAPAGLRDGPCRIRPRQGLEHTGHGLQEPLRPGAGATTSWRLQEADVSLCRRPPPLVTRRRPAAFLLYRFFIRAVTKWFFPGVASQPARRACLRVRTGGGQGRGEWTIRGRTDTALYPS